MAMKNFPPRLHVIFASEANYAVIVRRGPSKFASTFGWDLEKNEIVLGQWFKGRIDGHKSSLSPDGKYFLYSAMNGKWTSETKGTWAAISIAPYIKAIELYSDIEPRGGGGLFLTNKDYHLNEIFFKKEKFLKESNIFSCQNTPEEHCLYGSDGVYLSRLKMLGWKFEGRVQFEKWHSSMTYTKSVGEYTLIKKHIFSKYPSDITNWEEHEIYTKGELRYSTRSWECAEVKLNKVFFTEFGFLKAIDIIPEFDISTERLIHDFNGYVFEAIEAPYDTI